MLAAVAVCWSMRPAATTRRDRQRELVADGLKCGGACAALLAWVHGVATFTDQDERLWGGLLLGTAALFMVPIGMRLAPRSGDWIQFGALAAGAFVSRLGALLGFWY